jgi:hypothetical protein
MTILVPEIIADYQHTQLVDDGRSILPCLAQKYTDGGYIV